MGREGGHREGYGQTERRGGREKDILTKERGRGGGRERK